MIGKVLNKEYNEILKLYSEFLIEFLADSNDALTLSSAHGNLTAAHIPAILVFVATIDKELGLEYAKKVKQGTIDTSMTVYTRRAFANVNLKFKEYGLKFHKPEVSA
jgi:hypothetical protein